MQSLNQQRGGDLAIVSRDQTERDRLRDIEAAMDHGHRQLLGKDAWKRHDLAAGKRDPLGGFVDVAKTMIRRRRPKALYRAMAVLEEARLQLMAEAERVSPSDLMRCFVAETREDGEADVAMARYLDNPTDENRLAAMKERQEQLLAGERQVTALYLGGLRAVPTTPGTTKRQPLAIG